MKARTILLVSLAILGCLVVGYCSKVIRPSRPMFAWKYGYHPDRPMLPQWWFKPPMVDSTGAEAIEDAELNVLVVCATSPDVISLLPRDEAVAHDGTLIVGTSTVSTPESQITIVDSRLPGTPQVRGVHDRIIVRSTDGAWHNQALPIGLASDFRRELRSPGGNSIARYSPPSGQRRRVFGELDW